MEESFLKTQGFSHGDRASETPGLPFTHLHLPAPQHVLPLNHIGQTVDTSNGLLAGVKAERGSLEAPVRAS